METVMLELRLSAPSTDAERDEIAHSFSTFLNTIGLGKAKVRCEAGSTILIVEITKHAIQGLSQLGPDALSTIIGVTPETLAKVLVSAVGTWALSRAKKLWPKRKPPIEANDPFSLTPNDEKTVFFPSTNQNPVVKKQIEDLVAGLEKRNFTALDSAIVASKHIETRTIYTNGNEKSIETIEAILTPDNMECSITRVTMRGDQIIQQEMFKGIYAHE